MLTIFPFSLSLLQLFDYSAWICLADWPPYPAASPPDLAIVRRKRVTITEASLAGAPLQCWDNSTRGLDSANAIEFGKTLRLGAEYMGTTAVVAIYQAPQSAYDIFDKVSPRPPIDP